MSLSPDDCLIIQHVPEQLWVPVYTKPRCEKVLKNYCARHDIPCYLPLVRRAQRYQRRTVETFLPMFRSYLFAQLEPVSRTLILESHKVLHVLPVDPSREANLIRELQDIRGLERAQEEAALIVLPELVPGTPILISEGPFKGMTGIIEKRRNRTRVVVNVELLGQAVCAEMDVGEIALDMA